MKHHIHIVNLKGSSEEFQHNLDKAEMEENCEDTCCEGEITIDNVERIKDLSKHENEKDMDLHKDNSESGCDISDLDIEEYGLCDKTFDKDITPSVNLAKSHPICDVVTTISDMQGTILNTEEQHLHLTLQKAFQFLVQLKQILIRRAQCQLQQLQHLHSEKNTPVSDVVKIVSDTQSTVLNTEAQHLHLTLQKTLQFLVLLKQVLIHRAQYRLEQLQRLYSEKNTAVSDVVATISNTQSTFSITAQLGRSKTIDKPSTADEIKEVCETKLESSLHNSVINCLPIKKSAQNASRKCHVKNKFIQQNYIPSPNEGYDKEICHMTTIMKSFTPFHLYKMYSQISNNLNQMIDCLCDKYFEKHEEKVDKIKFALYEASNKEKLTLNKRLIILGKQQMVFRSSIENIKHLHAKIVYIHKPENIDFYYKEALNKSKLECQLFQKSIGYAYKNYILSSVRINQVTIISAEVCYATNEMVPCFLHQAYPNVIILSCEPNADTAILLAKKCQEFGGIDIIGCDIEGRVQLGNGKKLIITSASKLHNKGAIEQYLPNCKIVIIHCDVKRSLEADILLEQLRNHLKKRSDFRVILLLSPIDKESKFTHYFSSLTVNSLILPNITFPVKTVWLETPLAMDVYKKAVINTALAIHALNDPGDVLIFLPSSYDSYGVLESLPLKFLEYNYHNILCISLSGNYLNDLNTKLIEFNNRDRLKQKFYLTTHSAEYLFLPSVTYVIDSGIDSSASAYNKGLLNRQLISQEKATLRKHCAGQCGRGICYRLYSKEDYLNKMTPHELPEMLYETSPNIMIRLLSYYSTKVMTVDFVENLCEKEKEKALIMLKEVDAIKEYECTTLGTQIIKLSFLPRYAKLIVLGCERDFAFEAVVLVAFFLVNKPIFIYTTDEKESQRIAETTKRKYALCDSDTLTYLNIFQEFSSVNNQHSWCKERMLDFSVLDHVQTSVSAIINIVVLELGRTYMQNTGHKIKIKQEKNCLALQNLLFDCFKSNLCVYTGHGYRLFGTKHLTVLDSSSVLSQNNLPEFIVFDNFKQTSKHVMMNITSIPRKLVLFALKENVLVIENVEPLEKGLKPVTIENIGIMQMKLVLLGDNGEKLSKIENQIKKETECELIIIEPSEEKGKIALFTSAEFAEIPERMVHDLLKTELESLLNKEHTLITEFRKEQTVVPVNMTWKRGVVTNLIKPEMLDSSLHSTKEQVLVNNSQAVISKQIISLTWFHEEYKGYGIITFKDKSFEIARQFDQTTVTINGKEAEVKINDSNANELRISGLPNNTTIVELKVAMEIAFKTLFSNKAEIENIRVVYEMAFEVDKELNILQEKVFDACCKLLHTNKFTLIILKSKRNALYMQAFITLNTPNDIFNQSIDILNTHLKIDSLPVKAEAFCSSTVTFSTNLYKFLKQRIDTELELFNKMHDLKLGSAHILSMNEDNFTNLQLFANTKDRIINLQNIVYRLVEGEKLTDDNSEKLHRLFTHSGCLWLRTLEQQEDVHIVKDYELKVLKVYGIEEKCQIAIQRIAEYLNNTKNEIIKNIDLSDGKHTRLLLLQSIIKTYGLDMKDLIMKVKLRSAELSIPEACLVLHGNHQSIKQALTELENMTSNSSIDIKEEILACLEMCCVCYMPPMEPTVRLEHCAHLYCIGCLKGLIVNAKFPIQCCAEDCDKELFLTDIYMGLDYEKEEIDNFLQLSIKKFISKNSECFMYCPAPDCSMFMNKTKNAFNSKCCCQLCRNDICTNCCVIYHHGYTCEMYQGTKKDPDYAAKVWISENKSKRKRCPKCHTGIEKTVGCNHMLCTSCNTHFCWLCLSPFSEAQLVYDHQPYCPENQTH